MSKRLIFISTLALLGNLTLAHRIDTLNIQGDTWDTSGEVIKRTVDGRDSI